MLHTHRTASRIPVRTRVLPLATTLAMPLSMRLTMPMTLAAVLALATSPLPAQPVVTPATPGTRTSGSPAADTLRPFGTLREQAVHQQKWLELRMERTLPALMRREGVDLWVVPMREYNEDPLFKALVSPTTFAARRRTIYVFFDRGGAQGVERIALGVRRRAMSTRPCAA